MNPSGSEFTLRVAICDLVERLKRMQHKCSYLEECRNQLVKEVIRLRLQNEWLSKQISDSPEASSMPQNLNCFCNGSSSSLPQQQQPNPSLVNPSLNHSVQTQLGQALNGPVDGQHSDSTSSTRDVLSKHSSSSKDDSIRLLNILDEFDQEDLDNQEDSICQLTIQMLKDLENEMKNGKLRADLVKLVQGATMQQESSAGELIRFDDANESMIPSKDSPGSIDYEAFNNNSDYYSNSHNIPIEDLSSKPEQSDISHVVAPKIEVHIDKLKKSDNNKLSSSKPACSQQQQQSPASSIDSISRDELIGIIVAAKNDLKHLHQSIVTSTDKLNKVKSKQLRHFFQKQINLENVSTLANPPGPTSSKPQ